MNNATLRYVDVFVSAVVDTGSDATSPAGRNTGSGWGVPGVDDACATLVGSVNRDHQR